MVLGVAVAIKRCWLSVQLGKKTFGELQQQSEQSPRDTVSNSSCPAERYGEDLARVIEKKIIVGNVAALARDIEDSGINLADFGLHCDPDYYDDGNGDGDNSVAKESTMLGLLDGVDLSSRRQKVEEILGEWEQPPEDEGLSEVSRHSRQHVLCQRTLTLSRRKGSAEHCVCHSISAIAFLFEY